VDLVILAGTVGPGAPWARGLLRPVLPLPGTTIIEALLKNLREVFDGTCTICANSHTGPIASRLGRDASLASQVEFFEDPIPRGTAGCIKACESRIRGDVIFVAGASVWLEDDPLWMIEQHRAQGNALTVFCTRGAAGIGARQNGQFKPVGLYCCDPVVMDFIPEVGYRDLKEQLVPALQRAGLRVGAVVLQHQTCEVSDWETYLHAVTRALSDSRLQGSGYWQLTPDVWRGEDVEIAPQARVVGPALLGHGCRVADGAVVIGPTILGDGSHVGHGSWLMRVVAPHGARIPAGVTIADQLLWPTLAEPMTEYALDPTEPIHEPPSRVPDEAVSPSKTRPARRAGSTRRAAVNVCASVGVLAAFFIWAFWYSFIDLWRVWQSNADYSAGQLVPLAVIYMVAVRRRAFGGLALTFGLLGLGVFAFGLIANLLGNYYLYASLQNVGLVVCANGLVMTLLGWQGYKRVWYPLLFLLLMIPLPGRVHDAVMLPLQGFGTLVSAGVLEIIGVPVVRYGHILEVGGHQVAVAEACSGLRMALAFLIVAGVVAYLIRRPGWQKVTVLLSSIPIAIICNVIRIVMAACLYGAGYDWLAQGTMHDMAGLLMMPAALCLILLELRLLSKLVPASNEAEAIGSASRGFGGIPSHGAVA